MINKPPSISEKIHTLSTHSLQLNILKSLTHNDLIE
uniref:Uncharacterized protein n=1 Tax=Arundo donax TaxID=35708 RepID=A0A0A9EJS9_ARUDO